ncbi:MAG: hypothetical protein V3U16_07005 [Candidatus Neomarinimicrobiota bacterium]
MKTSVILLILVSLSQPEILCGYIDPGTGSYFLQMILAVIFGGLFAIKIYFKKIRAFFKSLISKERNGKKGI